MTTSAGVEDSNEGAAVREERREARFEVLIAALLGLAAALTAFAGYQASLLDGETLKSFQEANRTVSDANTFYTQGNQVSAEDHTLFAEYAKANFAKNDDLAEYLETLMRPELVAAIRWWEDPANEANAGETPFGDENPKYEVSDFAEAEELTATTDKLFAKAAVDDDRGDQYTLVTVILALSLFLLGIAGVARQSRLRVGMVIIGTVVLVGATGMMLTV